MDKAIAIYLRLSLEDVDKKTNQAKDESNSIVSQRRIIQSYIENEPTLATLPFLEFCDDGYSGTNFQRPNFQRMIEMVKDGVISCVIVKDLSRFGRDYIEVGDYLENIFPFLGVRMISVNDNYDSSRHQGQTGGIDIAFKNLIYDYYSKDLSKKCKTGMRMKQMNGGYVTCCLYGYKVLPKQKHKMVIDPETAPIVRRVFQDVIAGKPIPQIVRELNAEGVPTPLEYKKIKRNSSDGTKKPRWTHQRIYEMLNNLKYTGCMVNNTRESRCIRDKNQRKTSKEEWIITENAHEPLVSKEDFDKAQSAIKHRSFYTKSKRKDIFPFYCSHCGHKLQKTKGLDYHFYCATSYYSTDEEECKSVRWNKKDIEEVIFEAMKGQLSVMEIETVTKKKETKSQGVVLEKNLKELRLELESIDENKFDRYLDYREGRCSRESFIQSRNVLECRQKELKEKIVNAENEYEQYIESSKELQADEHIIEQTKGLNEEALKAIMYDAIEKVFVIDQSNIDIIWKFDDLFENKEKVDFCPYNYTISTPKIAKCEEPERAESIVK